MASAKPCFALFQSNPDLALRIQALPLEKLEALGEALLDLLCPKGTHWNHVDPVGAAVAITLAADHGEKCR